MIRLWTIGHIGKTLNETIIPSKEYIEKIKSLIEESREKEVYDMVVGPDIKCQIISSDADDIILEPVLINGEWLYRKIPTAYIGK